MSVSGDEEKVSVEDELVKASGFQRTKRYKDRQDYLAALARKAIHISDEEYDLLTDDAANWHAAAIKAIRAQGEISDFPKNVDEIEEAEDTEDTEEADTAEESTEDETEPQVQGSDYAVTSDAEGTDAVKTRPEDDPTLTEGEKDKALDDYAPPFKMKSGRKPNRDMRGKHPNPWTPSRLDAINGDKDRYGFFIGTKRSDVMKDFEAGITMAEAFRKYGDRFYQALKLCAASGHKVLKNDNVITLIHKDDVKDTE